MAASRLKDLEVSEVTASLRANSDNRQKDLRPLNVALSKSETVDTDFMVGTS